MIGALTLILGERGDRARLHRARVSAIDFRDTA
jgi:hypothetical protein